MAREDTRETFAVPVTSGYAPEEIIHAQPNMEMALLIESFGLAVDVLMEVWVLRSGGATEVVADWFNSGEVIAAPTASKLIRLSTFAGMPIKIRANSGGTAGSVVCSLYTWHGV